MMRATQEGTDTVEPYMNATSLPASRTKRIVAGVLLAAIALPLAAQTPAAPAKKISFGDAVRIALQQNITLQQAENAKALTSVTVQQQRNLT